MGWLIAFILTGLLLWNWRKQRALSNACDLLILQWELYGAPASGSASGTRHDGIFRLIDELLRKFLDAPGSNSKSDSWGKRRRAAWELLCRSEASLRGAAPPWETREPADRREEWLLRKTSISRPETESRRPDGAAASPPGEKTDVESEAAPESGSPLSLVEIIEMVEAEAVISGAEKARIPGVESDRRMEPESEKVAIPASAAASDAGETAVTAPVASGEPRANPIRCASGFLKSLIEAVKNAAASRKAANEERAEASRKMDESTRFAWAPIKPGAFERAFKSMSGWSDLLVPFLARNIGWLVGGFLFIAGSIFLVIHTSGFTRSSTISIFLFCYTLLLLAGAHRILRREPGARAVGGGLITLGMLLIPLAMAASVRLVDEGWGSAAQTAAGVLLLSIDLVVFHWAARLASGVMDRSLRGPHPKLFLILAGFQAAAPLVARAPHWPLLALLHLALMALMGFALKRFTRDWLKSIFLEKNRITYYAAGSLAYAGVVSFIHLSMRFGATPPDGYAGPFLMILSGMLFYVDFHLKQWTGKTTWLSRFNFLVYGLSVLSLALVVDAPAARLITLALGAILFGALARQYRTRPPLYLMLICMTWLYGMAVPDQAPREAHFFAGVPGLFALVYLYHRALKQGAMDIASFFFRAFAISGGGLAAWSLFHSEPGFTALATCLSITGALYGAIRFYPFHLLNGLGLASTWKSASPGERDLRGGPWFYTVAAAGVFSLAWVPAVGEIPRVLQFALGLVLLAGAWTALGLRSLGRAAGYEIERGVALLNSSLPCLVLAMVACAAGRVHPLHSPALIPALFMASGVLLWQGGVLRVSGLIYAALLSACAGGALLKSIFFPGPSVGLVESLVGLTVWGALFALTRREAVCGAIGKRGAGVDAPSPVLLWSIPTRRKTLQEAMAPPIQWAMVLLWFWVLFRLGWYMAWCGVSWPWVLNAAAASLSSALLVVYFRQSGLWFAPVLLGLGAVLAGGWLLVGMNAPALSAISALYALLAWVSTVRASKSPLARRLARLIVLRGGDGNSRVRIPMQTCLASSGIALFAALAALVDWLLHPGLSALPALTTCMVFFLLTGRFHGFRENSYITLALATLSTLICFQWAASIPNPGLLITDPRAGLPLALLGVGMWGLARILDRFARQTDDPDADFAESLYRKPLRIGALILASTAGCRELILFAASGACVTDVLPSLVLGLAAAGVLAANHALRDSRLALVGFLLSGLAMLILETAVFHPGLPLDSWPTATPDDRWTTLALLILGAAFLAHHMARFPRWNETYAAPLRILAGAGLSWSFLTSACILAAVLSGNTTSVYGPLLFPIQAVVLVLLAKRLPEAAKWRGVGVLILASGFAASILSLAGVRVVSGNVGLIWATALWAAANLALPRFNIRWPQWRISTETWPWVGLALACLGLADAGRWSAALSTNPRVLLAPLDSAHLVACAVYCALMRRAHDWKGLPWAICLFMTIVAFKWIDAAMLALGMTSPLVQSLNLAMLASGISALAWRLASAGSDVASEKEGAARANGRFAPALRFMAALCFGWALYGVGAARGSVGIIPGDYHAPLVFITLVPGLFFLIQGLPGAFKARGAGVVVLLSAAWFSLLAAAGADSVFGRGATAWAFILWGLAGFVAPLFNKRLPGWRLHHAPWPWLGLALLVLGPLLSSGPRAILLSWTCWFTASVYLALLLKNKPDPALFRAAAGAFTAAGILLVHKISGGFQASNPTWFIIGALAWANLLLFVAPVCSKYGRAVTARFGWTPDDLAGPLIACPSSIPWFCLILAGMIDPVMTVFHYGRVFAGAWGPWIQAALSASFLHLFLRRRAPLNAHGVLLSLLCLIWAAKINYPDVLFQPPLLLALWSAALFAALTIREHREKGGRRSSPMFAAISRWLTVSPWLAILLLPITPVRTLAETLAVLAITAGVMAGLGWRWRRPFLLRTARILALVLLHAWPLFFIPSKKVEGLMLWQIWPLLAAKFDQLRVLFPWWALQMTLTIYGALRLQRFVANRFLHKYPRLGEIEWGVGFMTVLAVGEWVIHMIDFIVQLRSGPAPDAWIHGTAALGAASMLIALGARHLRRTPSAAMVYVLVFAVGAAGVYFRLLLSGLSPLGFLDSMAPIAAAYGLFMVLRFTSSRALAPALLRLTLTLPLLALATIPIQETSAQVCGILLSAGALYLSVRHTTGSPFALYMGALAINGALYLWIPGWSRSLNLIQLYVVPAAVSVLILLHLHRRELNKSVLNGSRLAAVSVLYACAFIDFFLLPDLAHFLLALGLGLLGVLMGVALRIRAFLYGGSVFLVMNVIGQMILYYPREGLAKGIILVLLGTLITGSMTAFHLRREAILARMRVFRNDLSEWE